MWYYLVDKDSGRVLVKASYPLKVSERSFLTSSELNLRPDTLIYDFAKNMLLEKSDSQRIDESANARRLAASDAALLGQKIQRLKKEVGMLPAETRSAFQLLLDILGL